MDTTTTVIERSLTLRVDLGDCPYPSPTEEIQRRLDAWVADHPQPDLLFLGWKLYLALQLALSLLSDNTPMPLAEYLGLRVVLQPFPYHVSFGYANQTVAFQTYIRAAYRAAQGDEVEAV